MREKTVLRKNCSEVWEVWRKWKVEGYAVVDLGLLRQVVGF